VAEVELADLAPREDEQGTPQALLRGVAAGITARGGALAGFDAYVESEVLPGSGLSSSAAFEVLLAQIINAVGNEGALDAVALAKIGQYAENEFFGKPCGLMDQLACAVGGVLAIDFHPAASAGDGGWPRIDRVPFRFAEHGLRLFVIDTGGSHADLTEDYAAVRREMNQVAEFFGAETLGELDRAQLDASLAAVRRELGDRAVLRATHFFDDTERVDALFRALQSGETQRYLALVQESGLSSLVLLQNCYSTRRPDEQGIPLAVTLTRRFLARGDAGRTATASAATDARPFGRSEFDIASSPGACRVQGGGFAGTVQAYVTEERAAAYRNAMESVFGAGSVTEIQIRSRGAVELAALELGTAEAGAG
jgi:galactokinase